MLHFIPKARKVTDGFAAVVMQRNAQGRMHGSAASAFTFDTEAEALAHAMACARRVSDRMPFTRVVVR